MVEINGYKVDEKKGFVLTKGKNEKVFDNYADAMKFMQQNYGYMMTYHYCAETDSE